MSRSLVRTCHPARTGTSSRLSTTCTTAPAGRPCASLPATPASPTPPSPRPSPPRPSRPGARSSSSSRPSTATQPSSTTSGSPPPRPPTGRVRARPGSPAARPSSPPYAATSRPAPACSSSPARPAWARRPWSRRRPWALTCSSPPATASRCRQRCPCCRSPTACAACTRPMEVSGSAQAVATCPPYVASSLAALLPEAGSGAADASVGTEDRQLLFTSVGAALRALVGIRPLAILLEDLHWADAATLDLLEHLLGRGSPAPVLGSWRTGDDTTPQSSHDWFTRVRRQHAATVLELGPLSLEETAEQLRLLGGDMQDRVDRIHTRSQGQPLFTEQLAAHLDDEPGLPGLLADLLDRRLDGLSETAWAVVRTLGVAERSLSPQLARRGKWAVSRRADDAATDPAGPPADRPCGRRGGPAPPPLARRSREASPRRGRGHRRAPCPGRGAGHPAGRRGRRGGGPLAAGRGTPARDRLADHGRPWRCRALRPAAGGGALATRARDLAGSTPILPGIRRPPFRTPTSQRWKHSAAPSSGTGQRR